MDIYLLHVTYQDKPNEVHMLMGRFKTPLDAAAGLMTEFCKEELKDDHEDGDNTSWKDYVGENDEIHILTRLNGKQITHWSLNATSNPTEENACTDVTILK